MPIPQNCGRNVQNLMMPIPSPFRCTTFHPCSPSQHRCRSRDIVQASSRSERNAFLWPPYEIGQAIIFLPCGFFLSFFVFSSPHLSGRRLDVLPYFHTWCDLSANLECMSEMCCTRLTGNTGRKKIASLTPSHNFVGLYLWN